MPSLSSVIILSLAAFRTSMAAPVEGTAYAEIIPGPGLPSIEELGLTLAELYETPAPQGGEMSVFYVGQCGPADAAYANVNNLIACYNYLNNLGTRACAVPASEGGSEFCRAGDAKITGTSLTRRPESSYCRDVASGVLWSINSCTRPNQSCAGIQAANGNGNLIVQSSNIRY